MSDLLETAAKTLGSSSSPGSLKGQPRLTSIELMLQA